MRTVAIINQKGGCGKTTSAINLAAVLARAGKRTVLVDMDPQGHCAAGLQIPEQRIEFDIGDAMMAVGQRPIDAGKFLWRAVRNLDLAPARMKLAGLEAARGGLADLPDKERRLSLVLKKFQGEYDLAIIDCPPSIGLLTYNALAAADMVLIPVETGFFSLQGAMRQVNTVKTLSKRLGVQIPTWLLPTMHDTKNTVAIDLLEELHRRFRDRVVPVVIRFDTKLREASSFGQAIIDYMPGSMGAEDYGRLGVWTLENLRTRTALPADQFEQTTVATEDGVDVLAMTGTAATPPPRTVAPATMVAASSPVVSAPGPVAPTPQGEIKPTSRAEDVARRAQEFLRRVALGKGGTPAPRSGAFPAAGVTPSPTPAPAPGFASVPTQSLVTTLPAPSGTSVRTPIPAEALLQPARQVLTVTMPASPGGVSPALAPKLGLTQTSQGMLFVQSLSAGRTIAIAGTFNNWSPTKHVLRRNDHLGVHELCVKLPPGKFQYRLVIDSQRWTNDPHNPNTEPNPFGDANNVGYVSP